MRELSLITYLRHRYYRGKIKQIPKKLDLKQAIEPYAFIRVMNEKVTVKACLDSIKTVIKKGVIAHHKLPAGVEDDGTLDVIKDFIKENPGFVEVYYPYEVIPPDSKLYEDEKYKNSPRNLASYYNYALSFIPEDEWLIKIDCDQIYDTEKLGKLFYLPQATNEVFSLARLNLHYDPQKDEIYYLKWPEILREPGDQWLIYNKNLVFTMEVGYNNGIYYAWETLSLKGKKYIRTDLLTVHFPAMKSWRNNVEDNLVEFGAYRPKSKWTRRLYDWDSNFLSKENIKKLVKQFDI